MAQWYRDGQAEINDGGDWEASTIKAMLGTGGFTFDRDHASVTAVGITELIAANYTEGGVALPTRVVAAGTGDELITYTAGEAAYGKLGLGDAGPLPTVTVVLLYIDTGNPATDIPLLADFGIIDIKAAAPAVATDTDLFVDPISTALPIGTTITIAGNSVDLTTAAVRLDRKLVLDALTSPVSLATEGSAVAATGLPSLLTGGDWNWQL